MITTEYQKALLNLHSRYQWGTTGGEYAGDSVFELLKGHPDIRTVLDYGCGEGGLKKFVEEKGITDRQWTMYDPGMEKFKEPPKGKFDLVITTDVLEHVEEDMLDRVLDNLRDLTGDFLYSEIACYYTNVVFADGPYAGQDLHINMKAPDVWARRLRHEDFTTEVYFPSILEGWKLRCLVLQRVRT
jgi:hypothetical protein